MRVPDYCAPIIAWRKWQVSGYGVLSACYADAVWAPREPMRATMERSCIYSHIANGVFHPAPYEPCTCGVYAYATEDDLRAEWDDAEAWGAVKLWGRVLKYERGYRAEFAYPCEVWTEHEGVDALIAQQYGVPTHYEPSPEPEPAPAGTTSNLGATIAGVWGTVLDLSSSTFTWWRNSDPWSTSRFNPDNHENGYDTQLIWTPAEASLIEANWNAARDAKHTRLFRQIAGIETR